MITFPVCFFVIFLSSNATALPPLRTYTYARHSEGAKRPKNPPNGSSTLTTRTLKILHVILALRAGIPQMVCTGNDNVLPCPSLGDPRFARMTVETTTLPRPRCAAPRCALTLSHVIQSERQLIICCHSEGAKRPKNPPVGCIRVTTRFLKICCHSRALRGNPLVGCAGETTTYCSSLHGGSPLREDDGGGNDPSASTVGRVPLIGGFHGLRPLNDGELCSARPRYLCAPVRSHHYARHSRAPRGNPPVGSTTVTTAYCSAPPQGIPASRG